jgi:glycosyltransferase involved in cell wall biosynthesis
VTEARVAVDLWALGRRSYEVHWPVAQAFVESGQVELRVVVSDGNAFLPEFERLPVPLLKLALPSPPRRAIAFPFRWLRDRRRLSGFVRRGPRLVHVAISSPWDSLYLAVAKRAGATILVTVHDATPHPGEENRLIQWTLDRVTGLADHVAVLSNHVADELRRRGVTDKPIHIIPSGHLTTAGPLLAPRAFPAGRPLRLLFFGRVVYYKGLDLLLEAVAGLRREGFPVALTIAGAGDYEPYRARLAALDCVTLLDGWISVEEKNRLFAGHDVNMLPYREASQSGNALDGLFAAMPSIATRLGGLVEQLGEDRDTLFVSPEAPVEIAAAIRRLALEPALYERLSAGARAAAKERGPDRAARDWAALYRSIASP